MIFLLLVFGLSKNFMAVLYTTFCIFSSRKLHSFLLYGHLFTDMYCMQP